MKNPHHVSVSGTSTPAELSPNTTATWPVIPATTQPMQLPMQSGLQVPLQLPATFIPSRPSPGSDPSQQQNFMLSAPNLVGQLASQPPFSRHSAPLPHAGGAAPLTASMPLPANVPLPASSQWGMLDAMTMADSLLSGDPLNPNSAMPMPMDYMLAASNPLLPPVSALQMPSAGLMQPQWPNGSLSAPLLNSLAGLQAAQAQAAQAQAQVQAQVQAHVQAQVQAQAQAQVQALEAAEAGLTKQRYLEDLLDAAAQVLQLRRQVAEQAAMLAQRPDGLGVGRMDVSGITSPNSAAMAAAKTAAGVAMPKVPKNGKTRNKPPHRLYKTEMCKVGLVCRAAMLCSVCLLEPVLLAVVAWCLLWH